MSTPIENKPFIIDLVIVVCNGCRSERNFPIQPPFYSAKEFIDWEAQKPVPPCDCGYPTADFKLRIADLN